MLFIKKIAAVTLLCALAAVPASAAQELKIEEAAALTLRNNLTLRSLREEIKKSEAFTLQAKGTRLPSVALQATADRQREPQTNDGTDKSSSRSATATLEQVLYSGGKNSALLKQAPQQATMAELAVAHGENTAIGELYARFYNVLLKKKQIEAEEAAIKTSELHLAQVRRMAELGLANRLDVIRAGQQLASNNAALATAQGLFTAAEISLRSYITVDPAEPVTAAGSLYIPTVSGDRASSLVLAEEYRADRKRLEEQLGFRENQIQIEKSGLMPKVTAALSSGWSNPYRNADEGGDSWRAELQIAVPIFDRNVTQSAVLTQKALREQDKIALEQKNIDIKADVETAWSDIETTRKNFTAQEKALELAKETLRLAEVGFREGVTPQLDLLDAQSALTAAQLEYNRAQYNCVIAVAALKMTEGTIVSWNGGRR